MLAEVEEDCNQEREAEDPHSSGGELGAVLKQMMDMYRSVDAQTKTSVAETVDNRLKSGACDHFAAGIVGMMVLAASYRHVQPAREDCSAMRGCSQLDRGDLVVSESHSTDYCELVHSVELERTAANSCKTRSGDMMEVVAMRSGQGCSQPRPQDSEQKRLLQLPRVQVVEMLLDERRMQSELEEVVGVIPELAPS